MGEFIRSALDGLIDESYTTAVETGSLRGDGTAILADHFARVFTIEINPALHKSVASRFASNPNVIPLLGDSGLQISKLAESLSINPREKVVFWLDAHWSGDSTVDWDHSLWKGYNVDTGYSTLGHTVLNQGDLPHSTQQVPLDREIFEIYSRFMGECVVYIDDFDKISLGDLRGLKDFKFKGEDWSHLNFASLLLLLSGRITEVRLMGDNRDSQLLIKLSSRDARMPQLPSFDKYNHIISYLERPDRQGYERCP